MAAAPECRHIKNSGSKCGSPAMHDQPFCYHHHRQRERAAERLAGPAVPISFALENLEDRSAIQHAISRVMVALADYQIDTKRAGLLLYGLQLASSNAKDAEQIVSSQSVVEVTRTESGDELAPEGATSQPEQEESLGDMLMREMSRIATEYASGERDDVLYGPQELAKKELSQKRGEGAPPPHPQKLSRPQDDDEEDDEPESFANWPLDEFGHPKPLRLAPTG